MRKIVNGKYMDMSATELAMLDAERAKVEKEENARKPTTEERIAELEEALALLLSGEVE